MAKRITFQFEDDLDYQMQAIHSTVELFRGAVKACGWYLQAEAYSQIW